MKIAAHAFLTASPGLGEGVPGQETPPETRFGRSELSSPSKGIHEHLAVRLFQRGPDRQSAGEAGEFHGQALEALGDHQRRGVTLDVRCGAEDHLAKLPLRHPGGEGIEREAVDPFPSKGATRPWSTW